MADPGGLNFSDFGVDFDELEPISLSKSKGAISWAMSNMENFSSQLSAQKGQDTVYQSALNQIETAKTRRAAGGYAVMAAAMGYGESAMGQGTFGKISHVAKLFCIGFAFLLPSLLVWRVLL